jgi:hypothetical protein
MRVFMYLSESSGITALTIDATGGNLPAALGPWRPEGHAAMPAQPTGTEGTSDALWQALESQGYYLASAVRMPDLPSGAELSDGAYGRAEKLANTLIDYLTREPHGVLVTVGALELAAVRILNTLDQSGAVLEAFIDDLRQIFSETQMNIQPASPALRH